MRPQPAQRAPQFAPGAWNLWALALVGVAGYVTYLYSGWLAWPLLLVVQHLAHIPRYLPRGPADTFIDTVRAITTVGVVLGLARFLPASTPAAFGFRAPTRGNVGFAAAASVVLVLMQMVVLSFLNREIGHHPDWLAVATASHRGWVDYISDLVDSSVATPVVEETLFRGLLFAGLVQRVPAIAAASFSALLFAMWHQDPFLILPHFVVGLGLAFVYYRTRTLWAPIAVHAALNGLVVTLNIAVNSLKP